MFLRGRTLQFIRSSCRKFHKRSLLRGLNPRTAGEPNSGNRGGAYEEEKRGRAPDENGTLPRVGGSRIWTSSATVKVFFSTAVRYLKRWIRT
ncbi:hypothetical protein ACFX2I_044896 [Malus domestica]